ncbi:uncharacterized protein Z519_12136 [Cladophialophora bantiana CBS 173.52]|uniref:Uncharacterized protein n=1 Tax=Cladophialophora bantiana (strain ATCC 10958 / CBS 173.52 / CDC B-1940 / NIH 8579) TaxID=1442370 RepID=A0A0D2H1S3_CLAB1|nr:uncharacterized protein Z519_12136 [Cladophialophora bantiana CBS 173.52]KIW87233.1 hypothetical protein Z519_12136 [Cladophialophora bantiana CBS 173.52]
MESLSNQLESLEAGRVQLETRVQEHDRIIGCLFYTVKEQDRIFDTVSVAYVRELHELRSQLNTLIGVGPPPEPPQAGEPQTPEYIAPLPYRVPPAVWLPPGPPPQLCYIGRAGSQSDLEVIAAWCRRLGQRVTQGQYSALDYRRDITGRNRVEVRKAMPNGFLQGWVLDHTNDTFGYFVPEKPGPGWPKQLKVHNDTERGIFIAAVECDDAGLRPTQDCYTMASLYPVQITSLIQVMSNYWEMVHTLSRTHDITPNAKDFAATRDLLRLHWQRARGTVSRGTEGKPQHQKAVVDIQAHEYRLSEVANTIQTVPDHNKWEHLETLLAQSKGAFQKAEWVLRNLVHHDQSGQNPEEETDTPNPFVEEYLQAFQRLVTIDNSERSEVAAAAQAVAVQATQTVQEAVQAAAGAESDSDMISFSDSEDEQGGLSEEDCSK